MGETMAWIPKALVRLKKGATAVEYGLIAALIVLAMLGALRSVATETSGMWNEVSSEVGNNVTR